MFHSQSKQAKLEIEKLFHEVQINLENNYKDLAIGARKQAEKKLKKLKETYTVKAKGGYDVKYMTKGDFEFTPVYMGIEEKQPVDTPKKEKKGKKEKEKKEREEETFLQAEAFGKAVKWQ